MLKVADLSKLSARFGRFLPNYYPGFLGVVRVVRVKIASRFRHWLLSRTLGPDLALFVPGQDRTGPSARESGRISGTKKDLRGPLTRDH